MKFGGTSVGSPERMQHVKQLITDGEQNLVVLSAVSGTTNTLVQIAYAYQTQQADFAKRLIDELYEKYQQFITDLFTAETAIQKAKQLIEERFNELKEAATTGYSSRLEKIILAQGELISTHFMTYYLEENEVDVVLLPALDFMRTLNGEPDLDFIEKSLKGKLAAYTSNKLFITQGYICRNEHGEVDNLQRGGSDYTASLVGAALNVSEIQIWTDIDGMHNNDPRVVKDTFPVHELSFDEAAELAYFGAKILHPASIIPAQKHNIPVRLLNTMKPEAKGTVITSKFSGSRIKAIAAKDGIIAIKIRSSRMLMAYGFLRKVFEVFEKYKTPIDMITTSEVAVSLTIDHPYYLQDILRELKEYGHVEVDRNQTIISIVGLLGSEESGIASRIFNALADVPIRMISSGGSRHNVSILVKEELKEKALHALNEGLFEKHVAVV